MRRFIKIIAALFFLGAAVMLISSSWLEQTTAAAGPLPSDTLVYIPAGSSIKAIEKELLNAGAIVNGTAFTLSARWKNRAAHLKAGEYLFPAHASINDLIAQLQGGKTYYHQITLAEGLTSAEITELLNSNSVLSGSIVNMPAEGSLLPETYSFSRNDERQTVIKRMQEAMQAELETLWPQRAAGLPLKSKEEAVILASIVEKETGIAAERPRVAGVFINRLNKKIPLQTDPTVIYALTQGRKKLERALTYDDLKIPSPYNTYLVQGLPPAPIANPGRDSLRAVLNPENNDYLYFVADGSGGHVFAATLQEHNKNVQNWKKIKKNLK